jgi:hypothetical protein
MMRASKFLLLAVALFLAPNAGRAQSPEPIIVEAASSGAVAAKTPKPAEQDPVSLQGAIELLEQIKAANAELLKKQEATLQHLDELGQAADQLKAFSKRG